jgi:tRNA (adenine57-N1/adenine58-N1)-methyltransferase
MKKLLMDWKGKRQLVEMGQDLHTHAGVIKKEDLEAVNYSGKVKSHKGKSFYILDPSIVDFIGKMEKRAQIVYPKDSSAVIGLTGIRSGSRVLEAGTGVAGMTLMLANTVAPKGKVYSYEVREEHQKEAKKHIREAGLENYVEMKLQDIYKGIDEKDLDMVFFDLPEPWEAAEHAAKALKFGGYLASYSPSIEQVKKFVNYLPKQFEDTQTIELILREWEVSPQRMRPKTRMIGHTAFLTITRKLNE